jgi:hypothetical protein
MMGLGFDRRGGKKALAMKEGTLLGQRNRGEPVERKYQ